MIRAMEERGIPIDRIGGMFSIISLDRYLLHPGTSIGALVSYIRPLRHKLITHRLEGSMLKKQT